MADRTKKTRTEGNPATGRPTTIRKLKDDTAVQHCRTNRDGPKNMVPSWKSSAPTQRDDKNKDAQVDK